MGEGGVDGEQGTVKGRKEDWPEPGRGQGREPVSKKRINELLQWMSTVPATSWVTDFELLDFFSNPSVFVNPFSSLSFFLFGEVGRARDYICEIQQESKTSFKEVYNMEP